MWVGCIGLAPLAPSGFATRQCSLAYSSKPVHNPALRPPRKEAPQAPERNGPGHGRTPHTPDPQRPATTTGTTTLRPGTHRRAAAGLDVTVELEIGCWRVKVRLRLRLARGRDRAAAGDTPTSVLGLSCEVGLRRFRQIASAGFPK